MRNKFLTGLVVALTMVPALASAQSTDAQSQIQALLSQIQALQVQLKTIVASTSVNADWKFKMGTSTNAGGYMMPPGQMGKMACVTIARNLRQGDQGEDVRKLQELLMQDGESGFNGSATGFFGPLTMKAMAKFQTRMGIASSTDGAVGPLTRGFFERKCGYGMGGGNAGQGGQGGQGMGSNTNGGWGMGGQQGGPGMGGGMMQVAMVRGTISAVNGSSITVQSDGNSTVVNVTSTTTIKVWNGTSTPATDGTIANLVVGKKVMAGGTKNSDGSIQAAKIAVGDTLPMEGMPQTMNLNLNGSLVPQIKNMVEDFMKDFKNGQMPTMQMWQKAGANGSYDYAPGGQGGQPGQPGQPGAQGQGNYQYNYQYQQNY